MTDNKELYAFGNLRHYLNSKGIHVREPYAPIDPNNKEYYKGGTFMYPYRNNSYNMNSNSSNYQNYVYAFYLINS